MGRWQTTKEVGPLPGASPEDDIELGKMSFFLTNADAFHATGLAQMLDAIQATLPEALPARFGQYEPLQGRVENGDTAELLQAFAAEPDHILKARAPYSHIYLNVPCTAELAKWHPAHRLRNNFLAARITFVLRPKAFNDPRLLTLFQAISSEIGVFYSELRTSPCPTPAWFWTGLPKGPVKAFCLGDPYITLWPEAAQRGVLLANNTILVAPTRLDPTLPEPPEALADPCDAQRPGTPRRGQYAKTFPFQIPDLPNA